LEWETIPKKLSEKKEGVCLKSKSRLDKIVSKRGMRSNQAVLENLGERTKGSDNIVKKLEIKEGKSYRQIPEKRSTKFMVW